ncbi:CarD family transcriptional regulator [Pseudoneobacillus rhizosphaerae]|jgi:CarD family transcriptional regulator|uniref:RNA polymerase-binding transcription factor CarD n=1 Tax=Pseudoneobacillus rhizosphaerae TaxID=2880968 RepID=A0A9C7LCU4_9BACI|nr:CarD family transcriptional regulator [Pseudoneobacillus rhizosphaerae]CAG9610443.1 RNA polymerase-binding transcription factor CarD [Pseudoneobacillus rhizosphaerae]
MFDIGDVIIYSEHGLCQIDDICEKTIAGVTRTYYILHPLAQENLQISTPIDNNKVVMLKTMEREEAEQLLESFKKPGIAWIEEHKKRYHQYLELIQTGDRKVIADIAITLMQKNLELKENNKRLYDQDRKLLQTIQNILFNEMAMSMNTSFEEIEERVNNLINAINV